MRQLGTTSGFRYKILRTFRFAIIIGLSCAFIGLGALEYKSNVDALIADSEVLAKILGNRSVAALVFNDVSGAESNLSTSRFNESVILVCLYNKTGNMFAIRQNYPSDKSCISLSAEERKAGAAHRIEIAEYIVFDTIIDQGELLGYVKIHGNMKKIYTNLLEFWLMILLAFFLVWLVMNYVAKRTLVKVMMPLEELSATANEIAVHKLYETRARKISDDEIGELVDIFNQMLDSIAEENHALTQSEARFRTLTNGSPVGIFQLDSGRKLMYANEKWYETTGLKNGEGEKYKGQVLDTYQRQYSKFWESLENGSATKINEFAYRNPATGVAQSFMEYVSILNDTHGKLQGYIGSLLDVSELKNAQIELEKLAFYDPLTNLPNRRLFRDHLNYILANVRSSDTKIAVMMLDLDNFKKVNDTLGHDIGDSLLNRISERMQQVIPKSCVLSRMGGDEFLFLLPDTSVDEAATTGQKLLEAINEPIEISNHFLEISSSIGVAIYPDDGTSSHDLIKNVDMALYNAKDNGRNQINFYSRKLDRHIKENMRLESKLIRAIGDEQLNIYLPPMYSPSEGKLVWAEALLRWRDPVDGFIPPARFIPLAESLGVIHRLGRYVINQACYNLASHGVYLKQCGIGGISINLSAMEFFSRSFLPEVRDILRECTIDPALLEFEITESIVMGNTETAINIMKSLRDLGCRLSIDDFGTGYSSLSYLKRFPITALKIDQSFVKDIPHDNNDVEICTAIIAMAHKLGLAVVAEGVENTAQSEFLIEQGCELLQGFLFAQPEDMNEFVKRGRRASIVVTK